MKDFEWKCHGMGSLEKVTLLVVRIIDCVTQEQRLEMSSNVLQPFRGEGSMEESWT